jgi:hypothetical protein
VRGELATALRASLITAFGSGSAMVVHALPSTQAQLTLWKVPMGWPRHMRAAGPAPAGKAYLAYQKAGIAFAAAPLQHADPPTRWA